jgi:hypothetical protein
MPYSVLRIYAHAPGLVDALLANEGAVRDLLTSVGGFRFWGLARTDEGGATLTVCETAEGCAETVKLAAGWVRDNVPGNIAPPRVLDGETLFAFHAESPATGNPRVATVIFPAPPPQSVKDAGEQIEAMVSAVHGYRSWSATPTSDGQGGYVNISADDQAGIDELLRLMVEFNNSLPDVVEAMAGREPEVIQGEGVKFINA